MNSDKKDKVYTICTAIIGSEGEEKWEMKAVAKLPKPSSITYDGKSIPITEIDVMSVTETGTAEEVIKKVACTVVQLIANMETATNTEPNAFEKRWSELMKKFNLQ